MDLTALKFDRTNNSVVSRWWFTVDRFNLFALILLMLVGALLVTAASPPVAERIGLDKYHFVIRQEIFLLMSLVVMLVISLFDMIWIRRIAVLGFMGTIFLMMLLPFVGFETKGAIRWIHILGFSLQPSELMKPCFAVVAAWMFAEKHRVVGFPGYKIGIALCMIVIALLLIQPDVGMTVVVVATFSAQLVMAGVPFFVVLLLIVGGIGGGFGAYNMLPHVKARIDRFLNPESGDNYQIDKSLEAFQSGGLLGKGPGEGVVKWQIPDSHTDFVFSVAGEEFGMLFTLLIIMLYAAIMMRGFFRVWGVQDLFVLLASVGLLVQFGLQAVINMGVAVNLLPAKGMTLPFLSYGGSSLLGIALAMGMLLGLTRKQYGMSAKRYQ